MDDCHVQLKYENLPPSEDKTVRCFENNKKFKFDAVFIKKDSQKSIFGKTHIKYYVIKVLNGFHTTIYPFGQIFFMKTYTMETTIRRQPRQTVPSDGPDTSQLDQLDQ